MSASKTVLLVDDDPDILQALIPTLEQQGYRVVTASDGNMALATAEREAPDLVVVDMMMPRKSGFLVLEKLSCFDGDQGRVFGRWVQLGLSKDEMKGLKTGYTITVKAKFMVPASAYHIGDVVAMDAVIVSQSPP